MESSEDELITPERAMEVLKKDGIEVSKEQAVSILHFFYVMAEIVVDQYFSKPPNS